MLKEFDVDVFLAEKRKGKARKFRDYWKEFTE
jgi:hypothetical protein